MLILQVFSFHIPVVIFNKEIMVNFLTFCSQFFFNLYLESFRFFITEKKNNHPEKKLQKMHEIKFTLKSCGLGVRERTCNLLKHNNCTILLYSIQIILI